MKASPPSPSKNQKEAPARAGTKAGQSASQRATEEAKKGEPLRADQPKDRSPKQENL